MTDLSPYRDSRREFFRNFFEKGSPYDQYLKTGTPEQQDRWQNFAARLALSPQQSTRLQSFTRRMNILVMSGVWCGDCMRQGPMLRSIEQANPLISMRWLDNKKNPELQNELRINGAEKVPVVVVLSEDFFELARFGDRHLSVYLRKAETELGPACDAGIVGPSDQELTVELEEWVQFFERPQIMLRLAPMLRKRYQD